MKIHNERNAGRKPKFKEGEEWVMFRIQMKVPKDKHKDISIACKALINDLLKKNN